MWGLKGGLPADREKPEERYSPLSEHGDDEDSGRGVVGDISQIRQPPVVVGGQPIFGDGDRIRHSCPHVTVYTRVASRRRRLRARALRTHVVRKRDGPQRLMYVPELRSIRTIPLSIPKWTATN